MMDRSNSVLARAAQVVGIEAVQGVIFAALAGGLLLPLWLLWSIFH